MQHNCQITRCARQLTMDSVLKPSKLRRDLTGNRNGFTHAWPAGSYRFSAGVEVSVTWHTGFSRGFSQWRTLFVDSRRQIARGQNRSRMCEIRLTKLSCAAQQVGIVHFYAVTEIKGLSCRLWWKREWRNLLTSTHVGYRSVIRAVASGASLKFGVQGASATNWFSRVNGARDNGIWLYQVLCTLIYHRRSLYSFL